MLDDFRTLPAGSVRRADVAIVGGGIAGITLALALGARGLRVILLEAGGLRFRREDQDFYRGEFAGRPGLGLEHLRLRCLGGSSGAWGGRLRPLDPVDFEARDWIAESGWPFGAEELGDYWRPAAALCGLDEPLPDAAVWEGRDLPALPFARERLRTGVVLRAARPPRFGRDHACALRASPDIEVWLHACVTRILLREGGGAVEALEVSTPEGRKSTVVARAYVLAAGGIENARLLLQPQPGHPRGIGNGSGHVGCWFADHPTIVGTARLQPADRHWLEVFRSFEEQRIGGTTIFRFFAPAPEMQRRAGLPNASLSVVPAVLRRLSGGLLSALHVKEQFRVLRWADGLSVHGRNILLDLPELLQLVHRRLHGVFHRRLFPFTLTWRGETRPLRESRVVLTGERDPLGLFRARVEWRLPPELPAEVLRLHRLLDDELRKAGIGRLVMLCEPDGSDLPERVVSSYHHMGTTRMHDDPRRGVVDRHCRVHGIGNLYIAGSSVFPAYGHANPTLTIVALTLRLADRLDACLTGGSRQSAAGTAAAFHL
jgi:choline dehydrogenase-like flavoprotein